ncbi:MAG: response regulator [Anaerolineae bacterium]
MTAAHILIVDDDAIVTKTMALILKRMGYETTPINNPAEALRWLQLPGNYPDLLISDVNMPQMSGYDFVSQVRANPATTHLPVIMLTANNDIDHKVEGFKAGADDYLTKPVDRTELEWRIKAILARASKPAVAAARPEATVISVFSLRGGVGTTTMAVNMAVSLAYLWGKPVGLLDLALKNNHCAMMLNQKPQHTLASIAGWDTSVIEADVIEKMLLKHETGVRTLSACMSPVEAELVTVPVLDRVWPFMKASHPTLVVDAGSQLIEPNLTVLERSNFIVLMLAPELTSLKAAVDTRRVLKQIGIPAERILPVINWIFADHGLPQNNIEAALKSEVAATIPHNKSDFVQAINSGHPEVMSRPTSKTSMAITALAYKVSAGTMETQASGAGSKWLEMARKLARAA